MSATSRLESKNLYHWVVTPEEFAAGQVHAVELEEIKRRAERAQELGVIRTALKSEARFAVEFAPVTLDRTSASTDEVRDRVAYSIMRLRWTNLTRNGGSYNNTPPLSINQKGLMFNNDPWHRQKRPRDISNLEPNEVTGYLVDREYAYAAAGVLPLAVAREFISLAETYGIYIPRPGFVNPH